MPARPLPLRGLRPGQLRDITNQRASVVCQRRWPDVSSTAPAAPHLVSAVSNRSWSARFHPAKEEYICCYFKSTAEALHLTDIQIEVDGFGVPCLSVSPNGAAAWQANCLRPPGLEPGRHTVQLRLHLGGRSNPVEFLMLDDAGREPAVRPHTLPTEPPDLCSVEFQPSKDLRIALNRGGALVCYFRSPAESLGVADVTVEAQALRAPVQTVGSPEPGIWQVNLLLQTPLREGAQVRLKLGDGQWSALRAVA